ncbi:MAG: hypothetical protein O3A51_10345, partial [Verrucomicrobia bacterium]|nr:hypothetical protein [Verrucomicrobiota bacterium]
KDRVDDGTLRDVVFTDISLAAMTSAAEFLIMGTTINVVSACTFEGQPVGDGRRRVYEKLSMALRRDMTDNAERLTPVFDT